MRRARDEIKKIDVPLYFVTALLALYLTAGNILRGARWPAEKTWEPWSALFVGLLIAALYVPLYALYKALDAHYEQADRRAAERKQVETALMRDLAFTCQQVVAAIADSCPDVQTNDLAAQIWLCRQDDTFKRRAQFLLPQERKSSGVVWAKGKGVAGYAWQANADLRSDLPSGSATSPRHRRPSIR